MVISADPPAREAFPNLLSHRTADQPVRLFGTPSIPLAADSLIRTGFDSLFARPGINPKVAATAEDMAMVRQLPRDDLRLALAPAVVLTGETASGPLVSTLLRPSTR